MPELKIIKENLSIFDKLEISSDAKTEYRNGQFEAIFPKNAETKSYVFTKYTFAQSNVEVPNNSVILGTQNDNLLALVPEESYQ